MANWYYNELIVSGEKAELEKFRRQAIGPNDFYDEPEQMSVLSFTNLMPVPQAIINDPDKRSKWEKEHLDGARAAWARLDKADATELRYWFATKNSAPLTFLKNLGKRWPKLKFWDLFVEPINLRYALFFEVQGDTSTPLMLAYPKEAFPVLREEAEMGIAESQYNLGVCYANGDGVKQDINEAKKWWALAAAQGNESATEALAKRKVIDAQEPLK